MQQASHNQASLGLRRTLQVLAVAVALVTLAFASCMLVTAGTNIVASIEEGGVGPPYPGPTRPEPPPLI